MNRTFVLLLALAGPFLCGPIAGTQLPDSLRSRVLGEYEAGRYWQGLRLLQEADQTGAAPESDLLLEAQGHLGWGDWEGALSFVEGVLEVRESLPSGLWYLLGRAREEMEDWGGAAEAYNETLTPVGASTLTQEAVLEVRLRMARALGMAGAYAEAQESLDALSRENAVGTDWVALAVGQEAAMRGATEETRIFLSRVARREVRDRGWDLPAKALLAALDSAGAEAAYWSSIPSLTSASDRGRAWGRVGELRLARNDSLGAKGAFHQALMEVTGGASAVTAASHLLSLGYDSVDVARRGAEVLAGAGRDRDALDAWGAYEALRERKAPPEVDLAVARVHLRLREPSRALERLQGVLDSAEPGIGAPALVLQAQALRSLGRAPEVRRTQDTLVARFPDRSEAVEILFLRADALHDAGDLEGAIRGFQATADLSPTQNLAGQARMRLGMIYLIQGEAEEAVRVFEGYQSDFPDGRRWDEAGFWAGRTLLSLGRDEEGREVLEEIRTRLSLSYYSVMAGEVLGEGYAPAIPARPDSLPLPAELREGLTRMDILLGAGLEEGAAWVVDELRARGREREDVDDRKGFLLRLARELNARGLTREGINLGWEVSRLGEAWNKDLLAAIYPFPYREMVLRSAQEVGLDPYLMAGLIRQESAFWREARSRADARGLMQVLPATGAQLARARGPAGFDPDEHLFRPEVNVHLGMAFFSDLRRRFGEDLSILLSAYNAGPTRALRWREFPEAGDLPRFVERIPFAETRGYVKNVLLNREIYAWLYGSQLSGPNDPISSRF